MPRRTKIIATLGPATDDPGVLERLIQAGVDLVRLNLSHDAHERHRARADAVRERAEALGRPVGVLVDLQGPKIRIGRFRAGAVTLVAGESFCLDVDCPLDGGDETRVGTTYRALVHDLAHGDILLLDDGAIELWVEEVDKAVVCCKVVVGGRLSDNKGINKKGGGLSAPALTEKDLADLEFAARIGADYVAVSFVRNAEDVRTARRVMEQAGGQAGIIAKIERAEAVAVAADIILAADAIMIARGDLGVEIGDAELPAVQKSLTRSARAMNSVVITATQMMQSMVDNPVPTRAEVFDVANAVLDGTDAVMLSAETAVGRNPDKAVLAMHRICREAEKQAIASRSGHRLDSVFGRIDEAVAMATMYTANHLEVAAIAALSAPPRAPYQQGVSPCRSKPRLRSRRQLRRREVGWRAAEGELAVRRITNLIRRGNAASLLGEGEA